jgi:predicted PurR-regulated permease PerM
MSDEQQIVNKLDNVNSRDTYTVRNITFVVLFICCITASIYIIYNNIQFDKQHKSYINYKPKTTIYYITLSIGLLIGSFIISAIFSYIVYFFISSSYKYAYNKCKMYFKENSTEFTQCVLNEQNTQQILYNK